MRLSLSVTQTSWVPYSTCSPMPAAWCWLVVPCPLWSRPDHQDNQRVPPGPAAPSQPGRKWHQPRGEPARSGLPHWTQPPTQLHLLCGEGPAVSWIIHSFPSSWKRILQHFTYMIHELSFPCLILLVMQWTFSVMYGRTALCTVCLLAGWGEELLYVVRPYNTNST